MKRRDTGQLRAQPRSGLGCSCLSGDSRDYQPAHPDPAKDQPGAPPAERKALLHLDDRLQMNEADSAKSPRAQEVGYEQRPPSTRPTRRAELLRRAPGRRGQGDGEAQQLVRLKRDKPDVPVVLTGCMVTKQQEKLKETFPHVDLFFDPSAFASSSRSCRSSPSWRTTSSSCRTTTCRSRSRARRR